MFRKNSGLIQRSCLRFAVLLCVFLLSITTAPAQTTVFNFQGRLNDGANPANGVYEMQFALFDAAAHGNPIGPTQTNANVQVASGIFAVNLDFGANAFPGANRFLEIRIRPAGNPNPFTVLSPRQQVLSVPQAIISLTANNALSLDGIPANQFVTLTNGGTNFIKNSSTLQTSAYFNIDGVGSADIFNVSSEFRMRDGTILRSPNNNSLFAGFSSGLSTTACCNSFFGTESGKLNTVGSSNSFFGDRAGELNLNGSQNSFFGRFAGNGNTGGSENSFFGNGAGNFNTNGNRNSAFGSGAGSSPVSVGNNNTFLGAGTDSIGGPNYATAIGADSIVRASNTIVLGRENGVDTVIVYGPLLARTLGGGTSTALCVAASGQLSACSSSLRYKTNIGSFSSGLNLVFQLRPVSFDWKSNGNRDVGFIAEDVAKIDPLFASYNANGEVEGVKYDRLSAVFVNAFKEQQAQIERQQREINALKQFVCGQNPTAEFCQSR